jgi:hypothetical protein
MLGAERPIRLGLETLVEVSAVEEPRKRVGLRQSLQGLALLLLDQTRTDVAREDLERREVGLLERAPVERSATLSTPRASSSIMIGTDMKESERYWPPLTVKGASPPRTRSERFDASTCPATPSPGRTRTSRFTSSARPSA